jgi:methionine-rich copper-binding protein CopC/putative copper export protein/ABC-type branched-subunit amino acid transport system substrate-binding protein
VAGVVSLALLPGATAAQAHPYLLQSAPAQSVAAQAPREVALSFTQGVIPSGSSVHVIAPGGRALAVGRPQLRGGTTLTAPILGRARPAVYTVNWVALGIDGHTVSGTFRFGLARPDGGPPPGVEALGAPGGRGTQSNGNEGPVTVVLRWLGLVAAGLLLAGALLRRRLAEGPDRRSRRLAAAAALVAIAVTYYALAASAVVRGRVSPSIALAQPGGVLALVRLVLLTALGAAAYAVRRSSPRAGDALLGAAGAAALVTYGLAGHVQNVGDPFAYVVQVAHVLAAGTWMGGLVALALGVPRGARALRVFGPLAAAGVALVALTGVLSAVREVRAWYFLRWSDYGHVVIAKAAILLVLAPLALLSIRALRRGRPAGRALRLEALAALALALLASTLAGLAPGRGELLPAQRGNLLAGAAFATESAGGLAVPLTLAPAQRGANVLAATPTRAGGDGDPVAARSVDATLSCACAAKPLHVRLTRSAAGSWSAPVTLASRGTWFATVSVDGQAAIAPTALGVGDTPAPGSAPREVLMTADLAGPDALRCRAEAEGAELAIARLDTSGGLPGGEKVALRLTDDGGSPQRAAALARDAQRRGAIALLGPCGPGAVGALQATPKLPALVADPQVPELERARLWRTAGEPYAEGIAVGRYLVAHTPRRAAGARVAALVTPTTDASARRLAGLASVLEPAGVRLVRLPPRVAADPRALRSAIDPHRYLATFLDGDPVELGDGLRAAGNGDTQLALDPDMIVAASPLLDESFQERSAALGLTGGVASPAEVLTQSADGERYVAEMESVYLPDRPSTAGLRGYVAGLALDYGLASGDGAAQIAARLRRPRPFTDALIAPWTDNMPSAGGQLFEFVAPNFLPATLIPVRLGGEEHSGSYFNAGAWERTSTDVYGPETLAH